MLFKEFYWHCVIWTLTLFVTGIVVTFYLYCIAVCHCINKPTWSWWSYRWWWWWWWKYWMILRTGPRNVKMTLSTLSSNDRKMSERLNRAMTRDKDAQYIPLAFTSASHNCCSLTSQTDTHSSTRLFAYMWPRGHRPLGPVRTLEGDIRRAWLILWYSVTLSFVNTEV